MKIHIGTDVNSNAIHSATITPANTADITESDKWTLQYSGLQRLSLTLASNVVCPHSGDKPSS